MAAPKDNLNRLTHGRKMRPSRLFEVGGLPKGYGLIVRACRKLRAALEKEAVALHGSVGIAAAAAIDSAVKAEMAAKLAQRWLRLTPNATLEQRLTLVREIRAGAAQRDQQIAKLRLGSDRRGPGDNRDDGGEAPDHNGEPAGQASPDATPQDAADVWAEFDEMRRREPAPGNAAHSMAAMASRGPRPPSTQSDGVGSRDAEGAPESV